MRKQIKSGSDPKSTEPQKSVTETAQKQASNPGASSMHPSHARGFVGEQSSGFHFGSMGYQAISGPSGSNPTAHQTNAHGADGIYYNSQNDHLVICDNKAWQRAGKVSSASALTKNRAASIDRALASVRGQAGQNMPAADRAHVIQLLEAAKSSSGNPPANVSFVVHNAHGPKLNGVSSSLESSGVIFVPFDRHFSSAKQFKQFCMQQQARQLRHAALNQIKQSAKQTSRAGTQSATRQAERVNSGTSHTTSAGTKAAAPANYLSRGIARGPSGGPSLSR
jgi:hypothetical protein